MIKGCHSKIFRSVSCWIEISLHFPFQKPIPLAVQPGVPDSAVLPVVPLGRGRQAPDVTQAIIRQRGHLRHQPQSLKPLNLNLFL